MGEQHAELSHLICWKMQGPPRAIPCLIAVRQTAGLVGRVQSSLPLALPFTSKLASFWMGLGSLGSRRGREGRDRGDKCGETTTRTRQVETNSEGRRRSTTSLAPRQARRFIQQSGKSDGCPSFRIHSIPRGVKGGGRDMKLSERIYFTQLLRRRRRRRS